MANIENGVFQAMRMREREEREAASRRPKCAWCGDPIWDDRAYRIDGDLVCPGCINECEEYVDDYEGY